MPDGVLPGGEPVFVVGKSVSYKLADAVESESLVRGLHYGHGDQSYVGVWRLHGGTPLRLDTLGLRGLVVHFFVFVLLLFVVTLVLCLIEGLFLALNIIVCVALLEVVGLQLLSLEPQTFIETVRYLRSSCACELLSHHCLHSHCTLSPSDYHHQLTRIITNKNNVYSVGRSLFSQADGSDWWTPPGSLQPRLLLVEPEL